MLKLNNVGDTIIEVMIAIAIIGSILGSSYVTANNSLRGTRQAQERTEALKFLEAQVESLKYLASSGGDVSHSFGNNLFCLNGITKFEWNGTASELTSYTQPSCLFGTDGRYHMAISTDGTTHTITAYWEGVASIPIENITVSYRLGL
jgi:type II secretory pathway pseudopilin PulG